MFLRRQVRWVWYSHLLKNLPLFVVIHTVKGFSIVNEAEVDVFLEFLCFLYDPECRGPAPADPGYSKERRLGEGQGITA